MWGYQLGTSHLVTIQKLVASRRVNRGFTVSIMLQL